MRPRNRTGGDGEEQPILRAHGQRRGPLHAPGQYSVRYVLQPPCWDERRGLAAAVPRAGGRHTERQPAWPGAQMGRQSNALAVGVGEPIFGENVPLRGLILDPGEHSVRYVFRPPGWDESLWLAAAGMCACAALAVAAMA